VASRKEEKEQRRAERLAREQQEQEEARRKRLYSIVVGGVLAVAAIAAVVVAVAAGGGGGGSDNGGALDGADSYEGAVNPPTQTATELVPAARAADCRLSNPVIEGRTHVDPEKRVEYKTNPPTSGNHDPTPAGDGVYDRTFSEAEIKPFVHTLEHGRVEIHYDPSLPKREIDRLGGLFNEDPYHMVLLPNRRMPYQVAGTAWGHLIGCEKITDETFDALRSFRDRYRDQGPEQVP
jgi:Protein of unknown function (DUF3105)